jgi:hypothetical protein
VEEDEESFGRVFGGGGEGLEGHGEEEGEGGKGKGGNADVVVDFPMRRGRERGKGGTKGLSQTSQRVRRYKLMSRDEADGWLG